jgi:hypothetical protein
VRSNHVESAVPFSLRIFHNTLLIISLFIGNMGLHAQGTAFTYQGRLNTGGVPANGSYDFTFALFSDNNTNGSQAGNTLTNLAVDVTNGLFVATLDFGANFPGASRWLAIGVRTNGGGEFTNLNPLVAVTPTPYAITAGTASNALTATVLTGTVSGGSLSGVYTNPVTLNNSSNSFSGTFRGDGSGLTNLPQVYLNVLTAGVTNDGVTDVTVPLQNLLNKGGAFYFPPGRYYAQELAITNNTTLLGNGAVLVYATNAANNSIFVRCLLNSNISISGLGFDGGDYSDITARTFNIYSGPANFSPPDNFYYWNPAGLRHGLQFNINAGGSISDIVIYGFGGIGLLPVGNGAIDFTASVKTIVKGVQCHLNFVGLFSSGAIGTSVVSGTNVFLPNWITNYVPGAADPEYMSYSALNLFNNTVGMAATAGNCTYVNSVIDGNLYGQLDTFGYNDHHGAINSIIYTHNINAALYMVGSQNGGQIVNCQFRDNTYGTIVLNYVQGITIDYCTFAPLSITNENTYGTGQNFFRNNTYAGTWAGQTLSTDGHLVYFGNHSYSVAGDNDGQPLTLLESGNTAGITFTNAAGTPFQLQVNPATNGLDFILP